MLTKVDEDDLDGDDEVEQEKENGKISAGKFDWSNNGN